MSDVGQIGRYLGEIVFGTVFLLSGLMAAGIAVARRQRGSRILIRLALWSGMYGLRIFLQTPPVLMVLPGFLGPVIPFLDVAINHLLLVFALLVWLEFSRGAFHRFIGMLVWAGLAVGVAGFGCFVVTGQVDPLMPLINLMAQMALLGMIIIVLSPALSDRYLVLSDRGVLAAGMIVFMSEALFSNITRSLGFGTVPVLGWLGFAILLFSLAYSAAKLIFANEYRLIEIQNELEIARQIQRSILPAEVPEFAELNVAAAYHPMNSVAGDYYDFIRISDREAGFFVADVSGHGVPAALIASMIRVAMHSVTDCASDPGEVLRRLAKILGRQLHGGKFVTAAYLYLNMESGRARYSAAGHPPMLWWNSDRGEIQAIESNGLLFGFTDEVEYPVKEFSYSRGDRFMLYTDGLTEAENPSRELFDESRLSDLIRSKVHVTAEDLNAHIQSEMERWQQDDIACKDDVTWIVVDVVK